MTIIEAIQWLKLDKEMAEFDPLTRETTHRDNDRKKVAEALAIAIDAMEKRIPKKTDKVMDRTWGTKEKLDVCPVCGCYIPKIYFFEDGKNEPCKKMSYCEHCGQAILWEE